MLTMKAKPTVANVSMPLANTEYSYTLPAGTRSFWLKLQDMSVGYDLQVAMVQGALGTTYFTVPALATHIEENIKSGGTTLYFRTTAASQVAEILTLK